VARIASRAIASPTTPARRVLVGGRASPLANAIDDATLEVVIPPGDQPGDTELVVFNRKHAIPTTAFHYAAQPTIDAITPADVLYTHAGHDDDRHRHRLSRRRRRRSDRPRRRRAVIDVHVTNDTGL
jgi:hypothetical protein